LITTRAISAGAMALHTKRAGSRSYGTMSMRSPRSSCTTACTREPFTPTQAPTGSTSDSRLVHRDLAAHAGLARGRHDLHDALVDLRHLGLEELDEQPHVAARQDDLRALGLAVDVLHEGHDALAGAVALARHLVARCAEWPRCARGRR
jgi:hypothetical protein